MKRVEHTHTFDLADHGGPFSYQASKDGRVMISWHGRQVVVLTGKRALGFLKRIADASPEQQQLIMARATGNFKRGNEKGRQ